MARLLDDQTGNERLVSWLRMTFPEARGESVLKPTVNSREGWWTHGQELIKWHYKRCGRSEEAHSVMKEDLTGGRLPSGDFGLVVDHDPGLQSEYCFEVIGSGREMGTQADESDAVLPDQHPGQSHGAISKVVVTRQSRTPCYAWLLWIRAKIAGLVPAPSG